MKHIVAINASPRSEWNTSTLVREAAKGAISAGAEVEVIDLYQLEKYSGCMSCFGCKLPKSLGKCVYPDDLAPVLEKIRNADGLILGSPNYIGNVTAGFRALFERLIFQYVTYKKEISNYNEHLIPVVFIMTSNASEEWYTPEGYGGLVTGYQQMLSNKIGPTKVLISADTLQVNHYEIYNWSQFDVEKKKLRHETVFPKEKEQAFSLGKEMVVNPWNK